MYNHYVTIPTYQSEINLATATLASTPYHTVTKQENLKVEKVKKEMKSQPKHPWCKKSCGQESKKAVLKKMWNQNGRPRPPAVDGI